jgi:3'(2'), 5'-bisphosphate nucleotidase
MGAAMDHDLLAAEMRRLAIEAGAAIMEIYGRPGLAVEHKADDSPVTEADRAADAIIAAGLAAAFPDLALITEEQAESHARRARSFLIVDPLDGTREFIRRRGDFTVNIALVEDGVPTRGIVYAPARHRLFRTLADGRAVEEAAPAPGRPHDPARPGACRLLAVARADNAALRVVASQSHRDAATDAFIARHAVAEVKSAGSSLKFCLLAAGEADLYPRFGPTMEWDTAAGDALLRAAGGQVLDGATLAPLGYGKPGWRNGAFIATGAGVAIAP